MTRLYGSRRLATDIDAQGRHVSADEPIPATIVGCGSEEPSSVYAGSLDRPGRSESLRLVRQPISGAQATLA